MEPDAAGTRLLREGHHAEFGLLFGRSVPPRTSSKVPTLARFPHHLLAIVLLVWPGVGLAQELVPPELAAKTVLRALSYDRALKNRGSAELVFAVLTKSGDPGNDATAFAAALKALGNVTVQEMPVRVVTLSAANGAEVARGLEGQKAQVLYVGQGFEGAELEAVQSAAARAQMLTTYRFPAYDETLALGVVPRDGKLRIVIRLASAKAGGAELDPQLLKLAQVK